MKLVTIRQRLNVIVLFLTLLLLVGVGLTLWMEESRSADAQMTEQLNGAKAELYYNVMRITDALRGLALEPKNELEKRRHHEAEAELKSKLSPSRARMARSRICLVA